MPWGLGHSKRATHTDTEGHKHARPSEPRGDFDFNRLFGVPFTPLVLLRGVSPRRVPSHVVLCVFVCLSDMGTPGRAGERKQLCSVKKENLKKC